MAKQKAKKASTATKIETEPATYQGPITNLPRELLTQIFVYLRVEAPVRPGDTNKDMENVRLACRGFRDCAWRAFGEGLQFTTFDLRSINSMSNLKAIAEHPDLAPFITSLEFCVGYVSNSYPGVQHNADWDDDDSFYFASEDEFIYPVDYLDDHLFSRLCCYRHHTRVWFDDAWDWSPCSEHATNCLQYYASDASKQNIITILSQILGKFHNLRAVKYDEQRIPASFRKLNDDILDSMAEVGLEALDEDSSDVLRLDILGVDILLRGLAAGNTALKALSIPVPAMYCQTLATYTDPIILQKVLNSVETFHSRNFNDDEYSHHLDKHKEFVLSTSNAPKLRTLKWHGWRSSARHYSIKDWMTIETPVSAPLLHSLYLELGGGSTFDASFFGFLSKMSATLKFLEFRLPIALYWDELIIFLATSQDMSLEKLVANCVWPFNRHDLRAQMEIEFRIPSKELVYRAARQVVLQPDVFKNFMEAKWAPKAPANPPKVKTRKLAKGRGK